MPISVAEFLTRCLRDPRFAGYAISSSPCWLWTLDGARILWANPAGAAVFDCRTAVDLAARRFGPADRQRRQVARMAGLLARDGAPRLERMEGFGAPLGRLRTCACIRLSAPDGTEGLLVAVADTAARMLGLADRVQRLIDGLDQPVTAFDSAGRLIAANDLARHLLEPERSGEIDVAIFGRDMISAAQYGPGPVATALGDVGLQRVGSGGETTVLAWITPRVAAATTAPEAVAPAELVATDAVGSVAVEAAGLEASPDTQSLGTPAPGAEPPAPDLVAPDGAQSTLFVETSPVVTPPEQPIEAEVPADLATPFMVADAPPSSDPPASPEPFLTPPSPCAAQPETGGLEGPLAAQGHASDPPGTATRQTPQSEPPTSAMPHDETATVTSLPLEPAASAHRNPLRFVWQMDAEGRFALGADEFLRLMGPRTATAFGRPWSEIAAQFGLDPEGRVAAAIATRGTWSGIVVDWPADGPDARMSVELSGLPVYDGARRFLGYRGFGMCRDLEGLERLAAQRRRDALRPAPGRTESMPLPLPPDQPHRAADDPAAGGLSTLPPPQTTETLVETPQNVVPFRPATEPKAPTLTPIENNAFNELARQLASRLESERLELDKRGRTTPAVADLSTDTAVAPETTATPPDEPTSWSTAAELPTRAESRRDALLYDRIPVGILVYQLDRLLYANRAFLDRVGHGDLQSLTAAGGLDALYVEAGATGGGSASEEGTPVRIAATGDTETATDARLHSIVWDGDAAHALIFASQGGAATVEEAPLAPVAAVTETTAAPTRSELEAVLAASDDGILICDGEGQIVSGNPRANSMFASLDQNPEATQLADLFAAECHDALRRQVAALAEAPVGTPLVCKMKALTRDGGNFPARLTMGRTDPTGTRFFAICRELPSDRADHDASRRKQAERAAGAKADVLSRISQELRTPLNAIIGFADVMIEERFGALGNERYADYLKDIRAAGERVLAIIGDMVDLSRAETGQLHLSLARQDLNEMVEQCVTVLQPQANRERIIIRTSLAQALPPVTADAAALRQIVLNLIGNSIHVARAGGQIIVSTAVTDLGDIVLRVRDTGRGLPHAEIDAALEQFRNPGSEQVAQDNAGINLSLTRALVEANQAQFHIKTAPHSGTLIEVAFPPLAARAM